MLQSSPLRNKFGFLQNQNLTGVGYGNGMLVPRRNALPFRGGFDPLAGYTAGGLGGLGGLNYGLNLPNGWAINPLEASGLGGLGGMGARGRLNPLFGAGPQYLNGVNCPLRAGFSPSNLSTLLRYRNRGNFSLGNNTFPSSKSHYVYPHPDEHLTITVVVQSSSGRRSGCGSGLFGRALGSNSSNNEFLLTIPTSATIADVFSELTKGSWNCTDILVVYPEGAGVLPLQDLGEVTDLIVADYLVVLEN